MSASSDFALAPLFQAVGETLRDNQGDLNRADQFNGNHGDHMVQVFELAAHAAEQQRDAGLPAAMDHAAGLLEGQANNGSAQAYALGLRQMAAQFRKYEVTLEDLIFYVRAALVKEKESHAPRPSLASSGEILKALASGLAAWGGAQNGSQNPDRALDMGSLFEFGMAYMQAKQRGQNRAEILADAAVSVTPLAQVPHRCQSGKIAIQALLEAMQ